MKISKILAGMSAAAIVASMAMIPASAAGTKLNVSDDLAKIGRQTQDDLFAVFFNGDESEGAVNKDAISDLGAVYGASFTIKVDNNDWNKVLFQGFFQYETRLRHGSFVGINDQYNPINHFHDPFHFSTEVRVSWCVHDIDSSSVISNGCIFSKDRDPTFFFKIV